MNQEGLDKDTHTVGEILRNSRESQGYTIAEVVRFTKIRYSHIKSMENDDFTSLPERTYTLGYIDKYCRFLGIETKPILKMVEEKYELKNPTYNNVVQNNRLDKKYNPINLVKESIIDFIFIIFSFGLKRYTNDKDFNFNNNQETKKKVPFIFLGIFLMVVIIIGIIFFLKKPLKISIEEAPLAIHEEVSKELELVKVKKSSSNEAKVNSILNQEDMIVVKNPHNKNPLKSEEKNNTVILYNQDSNNVKEKKNQQPKLTPWPKANKPSNVMLLFSKRVWVKIYNKKNKNEVYLDGYFKQDDYFNVPNLPDLCMDVGNYNNLYLLVNKEIIYLNSANTKSMIIRKIDLIDSSLLSKYGIKDI